MPSNIEETRMHGCNFHVSTSSTSPCPVSCMEGILGNGVRQSVFGDHLLLSNSKGYLGISMGLPRPTTSMNILAPSVEDSSKYKN